MKPRTIDQLDIKDHVRWAEDRENLDSSLVTESQIVAPLSEVLGLSAPHSAQFDLLFELQKRNLSWASFEPPKNFHQSSRRFFSHHLFSQLGQEQERQRKEQEEEENKERVKRLKKKIVSLQRKAQQRASLFEKDRAALLNVLESIDWINSLLLQIYGKKLQYQKG